MLDDLDHLVLAVAADAKACGCLLLPLGPSSSAAGRGLRLLCFLASPKLLTCRVQRACMGI